MKIFYLLLILNLNSINSRISQDPRQQQADWTYYHKTNEIEQEIIEI
jgi:hypothetical protein